MYLYGDEDISACSIFTCFLKSKGLVGDKIVDSDKKVLSWCETLKFY